MSKDRQYACDENCVAVIGMALRVPGADSPEALWDNLVNGKVSREHLSVAELEAGPHAELSRHENYVPYKYSIDGYESFDAEYFNMAPREASLTDPQQRLVLEYSLRAFENAGYVPSDDGGTKTGVFASADFSHYLMGHIFPHFCNGSIDIVEGFVATDKDFVATRVAYKCNFKGPALTVQSACSSSLTSLHMAVLSLLGGECDRAVVASGTVLLPDLGYIYEPGGIHSPDGLCRPFDAAAAGTVFSNGVIAVLLKPALDAIRDRDHIWAVIRGTAASNDGSDKISFVAPSIQGQTQAITSALAVSGSSPEDIMYIEGHGTGTQMGDPIEMESLVSVFGPGREKRISPVVLGSVKGNIGHLNATAGLSGFVKTCLTLHHGIAPGTAHYQEPNPAFGDMKPLVVSSSAIPLERDDGIPVLAGVSSFGFGGTNVHAVLQEPPQESAKERLEEVRPRLYLLSAPSGEALSTMRKQQAEHLGSSASSLLDTVYTLAVGRKHHEWRYGFVAESREEAIEKFLVGDGPSKGIASDVESIGFFFPGQGNLGAGAGFDFYKADPLFKRNLDRVVEIIRDHGGPDIMEIIEDDGAKHGGRGAVISSTLLAQPLLFALETAFAESLVAQGIIPSCLLGHSLGEYAAAVHAGIFSLEDGARLVIERARLMQSAPAGKMLMVTLNRDILQDVLGDELYGQVELSVVNGPSNCVLTGKNESLFVCVDAVEQHGQRGIFLNTSNAFHSADMDCILEPFRRLFDGIKLKAPKLPIVSNVTGTWGGVEMADPDYWVRHLRHTVEFDKSLETMASKVSLGIEVGPGHVMRSLGTRPDLSLTVSSGLDSAQSLAGTPSKDARGRGLLDVAGELWEQGASIDWGCLYDGELPRRCPLPGIELAPKRYWIDPVESEQMADSKSMPLNLGESHVRTDSESYAKPTNDVERELVEIWQDLLLIRPIGIHDDFLELGGNSVQVMQMMRLAEEKGLQFSVQDVFEAKTVEGLAKKATSVSGEAIGKGGALAVPKYYRQEFSADGCGKYSMFFDCPDSFGLDKLEGLAQALASRHDVLRLRWEDGVVSLHETSRLPWGKEHARKSPSTVEGAVEYSEGIPWFLELLYPTGGEQPRIRAVFSQGVCDRTGFDVIRKDIEAFLHVGELPLDPPSSWQSWLSELPDVWFSGADNSESKRLSGEYFASSAGESDREDVFHCCVEKSDLVNMLPEAASLCRMSTGDMAALGFARALCNEGAGFEGLRIWHDMRHELSAHHPSHSCVGPHCYPVEIAFGDGAFTDEGALICYKETLHQGRLVGPALSLEGNVWDFHWFDRPLESELDGVSLAVPLNAQRVRPTLYVWAEKGAFKMMAVDSGLDAERIAQNFIDEVERVVKDVLHKGLGRQLLPMDFPLCDITLEELNNILEDIGALDVE